MTARKPRTQRPSAALIWLEVFRAEYSTNRAHGSLAARDIVGCAIEARDAADDVIASLGARRARHYKGYPWTIVEASK